MLRAAVVPGANSCRTTVPLGVAIVSVSPAWGARGSQRISLVVITISATGPAWPACRAAVETLAPDSRTSAIRVASKM